MEITFKTKEILKIATDYKYATKRLGKNCADIFQKRLTILMTAETLEDVRYFPGHCHELSGNRKGEWAMDLEQPKRLIFEPHERPIPEDKNGRYVWIEIKGVEILEIVDYH